MVKKSSSNALERVDEQIKKLTEIDNKISKRRTSRSTTTVVDKRDLEAKLRENGPKKDNIKISDTKKFSIKNDSGEKKSTSKSNTMKINKLESELQSTYNSQEKLKHPRDLSNIKNVISEKAQKAEKELDKRLENVSESFLNQVLFTVSVIFIIFFITFIGLVILISTF